MMKEKNCNITPAVQLSPRFDQNSSRSFFYRNQWKVQRYGRPVQPKVSQKDNSLQYV